MANAPDQSWSRESFPSTTADPSDARILMTPTRLILLPDGPFEVTGPPEIARPDGKPIEPPAAKVYLCRCGRSANKLFCDGSHVRTGWREDA